MNKANLFNFVVEKEKNKIKVERSFQADLNLVWAAWTQPEILDKWWAPKPYQCITKSMNFTEGGRWHYFMKGPQGDIHWCLFDFVSIQHLQGFSGSDAFCDENAVLSSGKPRVQWSNSFRGQGEETTVSILLEFEKPEDLEAIIAMGFKEGFTAGLENLDQYLEEVKASS
jgi:PhnB protein